MLDSAAWSLTSRERSKRTSASPKSAANILETGNDPRDPEVGIARARVEPGVTTALHVLSVDERYVITQGRGRMEVEGLKPADVGPGDIVVIPKGRSQRITNISDRDLVFYCVCTPRFEPEHYRDLEG